MAAASRVAAKTAKTLEDLFAQMQAVKEELTALRREIEDLKAEKQAAKKEAKRA